MKITFIRHGQTDFNRDGKTQGQEIDLPLNSVGVQQVENTTSTLAPGFDLIISSPLKRAFQTAEIINVRLGVEIVRNDDLKEFSYGTLAGKTWPEIEDETGDPDIRKKDVSASYDYRPYGGESADDVKERVRRFIAFAKENYPEKSLLVTTHGGIIEAMHSLFSDDEVPEAQNAGAYEFDL